MARKTVEDLIASLSEPVEKPRLSRMKAAERLRCDYQRAMLVHARQKQQVAMRLLALLGPEAYLDDERILRALDTSPLDYEQQGKSIRTRGMMDRLERVAEYLDDMQEPVRKAVAALLARGGGKGFRKVKVYGVGGSATPAGMAREIIENSGCLGFEFDVVRRDSPRFEAVGSDTLLIFASFSGNTEETLNCLRLARRAKAPASRMAAMSSGGKLEEEAQGGRCIPWICIPKRVLQPRESLALQVVAILGLISELKLPGAGRDGQPFRLDKKMLLATGKTLRAMTKRFHCETPFRKNQAKQFAAKLLYGTGADGWAPRIPIVLSCAPNEAVAYELYTQLCEASKIVCHVAACPEALHNLVECMRFSLVSGHSARWSLYVVESDDDERRVAHRLRHTLKEIFPEVEVCAFRAEGSTPFERSMSAYCFNAWLRLYVAFLNGAEPLPVPTMSYMKDFMSRIPR